MADTSHEARRKLTDAGVHPMHHDDALALIPEAEAQGIPAVTVIGLVLEFGKVALPILQKLLEARRKPAPPRA